MAERLRIGTVAAILGVSLDTLRRWEADGEVTFERTAGGQRVLDADVVRRLLRDRQGPTQLSARNRLEGVVVSVQRDGLMAQVDLACGPYRVVSLISREAADELDLKVGAQAAAVVKATTVIVERA